MQKDSLIKTNLYLRNSRTRHKLLVQTVVSSTAIEGVLLNPTEIEMPRFVSGKLNKFYASAKSSGSRR